MFRRVVTCAAKVVVGAGSLQVGAAAVALTDKQLLKKPDWYQHDVHALEASLKALSKYSYIENEETLNSAEDVFKRFVDSNNPEILWRLSRVLAEKAELTKDAKKKSELLHDAVHLAESALKFEGKHGIAQAHKWFAISAVRFAHVDKKAGKCPKLKEKIVTHLKRAVELDPKDPYTHHLLGVSHYYNKDYKEAISSFQKAESVKPGFSTANLFYLGDAQRLSKDKTQAIETLKKAFNTKPKNQSDSKGKADAKRVLLANLKQKIEDIEIKEDF